MRRRREAVFALAEDECVRRIDFGGSAVTFSDVLGDQQFNFYAASISQYRTMSLSYLNLAKRFNFALQGYSLDEIFDASDTACPCSPSTTPTASRKCASFIVAG